jgi:hypothetical protein
MQCHIVYAGPMEDITNGEFRVARMTMSDQGSSAPLLRVSADRPFIRGTYRFAPVYLQHEPARVSDSRIRRQVALLSLLEPQDGHHHNPVFSLFLAISSSEPNFSDMNKDAILSLPALFALPTPTGRRWRGRQGGGEEGLRLWTRVAGCGLT